MTVQPTDILPRTTIVDICAHRDAALAKMEQAAELLRRGHELAGEAQELAQCAHGESRFHLRDRSQDSAYQRLFLAFDPERSLAVYRRQLDARVWMHLVAMTGLSDLMDRTAKEQLDQDLCGSVPEVSVEAARQIIGDQISEAELIFQRGLARAFSDLDRRFKSHDAFKIGSRIILTGLFDGWGHISYGNRVADTLADVERVFAVLDGERPQPGALVQKIKDERPGYGTRQSVHETPYFRIRCFKNGNAHLWMLRDDLVRRANEVLADYYGPVLPDAVGPDVDVDSLRTVSGLPAKDLSFYATPPAVVKRMLRNVYFDEDSVVLEPSAGHAAIVRGALEAGAGHVDAIEIDEARFRHLADQAHALEELGGSVTVLRANFLRHGATDTYTHVLMNPPFYGTHWMEHVVHAWDFLAPGGTLVAVLPISARVGDSSKHRTFRAWVDGHGPRYGSPWRDLPAESFASSGTRIQTTVLTLRKP